MFSLNTLQLYAKKYVPLLTGIILAAPVCVHAASDTLQLSLPQAEKRFLDSNLSLLAAHYNVDAQKALIQQAKLWDNPTLNTDFALAANGKVFPYSAADGGGQYYVQVQQLIKTAGKRNKLVNLASTNARLSELQLQDVMRNLRYQLRTDYYTIVQQLATRSIYQGQMAQLNRLSGGMRAQLDAGNIAQKEYLRIQALVISLEQDIMELDKDLSDNQADLKTLLQIKNDVFIKPSDTTNANITITTIPDNAALMETGKQNNPNYLLQETQTLYQQQNLAYQRSLRVPDLTLGPNYDKNSNFAPHYVGLGVSIPLPILNKNQGNIKSAEYSIKQQQSITGSAETELRNNITNAWQKWLLALKYSNTSQKEFYTKYEAMYRNVLQSYQQKQINLLEFLDFFNDFTESQKKLQQQQLNMQLAKEELNYHTGIDIIK